MRAFASIVAACAMLSAAQPAAFAVDTPSSWEVFTTQNSDLPANTVHALAIDKLGRAWMSCGGLTLFDGDDWTTFSGVTVLQVAVDANNNAWCASDLFGGALTFCNGSTTTSYNDGNSDIPSNWVTGVTVDHNNTVWAACSFTGIGEFDGSTWTKHLGSEIGSGTMPMLCDRTNTIWLGAGTTLYRYRNDDWTPIAVPDLTIGTEHVMALTYDTNNDLWVGTNSDGVGHYKNGSWTFYTAEGGALPGNSVNALAVDSNNVLWVGTTTGLASYDGTTWTTYTKDTWVLPDDRVFALAVSPDNSLWVGTLAGLLRVDQLPTDVHEPAPALSGLHLAPNPSRGEVTLRFSLPHAAPTTVELYTPAGQRVAVPVADELSAGEHVYRLDNSALASGSYYCIVRTNGRIAARSLLVVND